MKRIALKSLSAKRSGGAWIDIEKETRNEKEKMIADEEYQDNFPFMCP